jgi:predicted lipase
MLSYCCDAELAEDRLLSEARNVCVHSVENAFAISWLRDEVWMVAIRGTELEDWRDLVDDADVRPTPIYWADSSHAHAGFMRHFCKLQTSLLSAALKLPLESIEKVVFTGHSLGGAAAYLAACFFLDIFRSLGYQNAVEVRTFGAPRIGDENFRLWCAQRHPSVRVVSYVNSCDAVPKVPPTMAENWSDRTVIFKSKESALEAHHMRGYLDDIILLETHVSSQ